MNDAVRPVALPAAPVGLDDQVVCPRSIFVRALKPLLASSRAILPTAVYEPLYNFSFRLYKALLRHCYFRHVAACWVARDSAGLFRARSVYSVMPYSLVGASGLEATFDAASDLVSKNIPGDFVECGVARGGCAALLATVAARDFVARRVWLFDSFEGLPSPTSHDFSGDRKSTGKHIRPLVRGSCLGTKDEVEWLLFSKFAFERNSIVLVQGWFQDTLPVYRPGLGRIALLRIDGDWYESTSCCLENLYDNVSPGGWVIVDDYGVCFGCKKAVQEFFEKRKIRPALIPDTRGGIRFLKTS